MSAEAEAGVPALCADGLERGMIPAQ